MSPILSSFGGGSSRGFGRGGARLGPTTVPTSLALTATGTTVSLTWTNTDNTSQIRVYRGASLVTTLSAASTSYTNTGLSANTSYSFTVKYFKDAIEGSASNTASITTLAGPSGSPSSLNVSPSSSSALSLSWSNGDATSATQIFRNGGLVTTVSANVSTFSDTGLSAGTGYSYYVRHIKNSMVSASDSNTVSQNTCDSYGVLLGTECDGTTLMNIYADGNCGSYTTVNQYSAAACAPQSNGSDLTSSNGYSGCAADGEWDDTYGQTSCCSNAACSGSTVCCDPVDYGNGWSSCAHMCGSGCSYDYGFPAPHYYCS